MRKIYYIEDTKTGKIYKFNCLRAVCRYVGALPQAEQAETMPFIEGINLDRIQENETEQEYYERLKKGEY